MSDDAQDPFLHDPQAFKRMVSAQQLEHEIEQLKAVLAAKRDEYVRALTALDAKRVEYHCALDDLAGGGKS
jgi:hypothetical protein